LPSGSGVSITHYLPQLIQEDVLTAGEPVSDSVSLNRDLKGQSKLSFQSIPFKENLDDFDKKYTQGRFGNGQSDTLETSRVRDFSDLKDQGIPRVGLLSGPDHGTSPSLA
jgi:hypothetical protein